MKKVIIDEKKLGDFQYWDTLFKTKEEDFKKLKKQTKQDLLHEAYKKAPDNVRLNKQWVLKGLNDFFFYFFHIDSQLKDKQYCIDYVEQNRHPSLFGIPEEYQVELFEKVILKNTFAIRDLWYSKHLKHLNTKENLIKWIQLNPEIYKELGKYHAFKNDFTLAEVAVKADIKLLFKMTKSIARKIVSRNLDMALKYMDENIKKNIEIFILLPLKVRNDKDFILKYADKLNYECIPFIGSEALEHKEVILSLKNFYNLKLPEKFAKDKDIAYHITRETVYVYPYFKDCENFTLVELMKDTLLSTKSIHFYDKLPTSYKNNPEIISAFLEINFFPEARQVKKYHNLSRYGAGIYEYEETEYFETSVVKLLSEEIKTELVKEFKEVTEEDREPEELELLKFAKAKYLQLILNNKLEEKIKVKKMKI